VTITTTAQDNAFSRALSNEVYDIDALKDALLDSLGINAEWAADFVRDNFKPGDVFEKSVLRDWAFEHDFMEIGDKPEDVFTHAKLANWAKEQGYSQNTEDV
jgi:hypothetical protein